MGSFNCLSLAVIQIFRDTLYNIYRPSIYGQFGQYNSIDHGYCYIVLLVKLTTNSFLVTQDFILNERTVILLTVCGIFMAYLKI